MGTQAEKKKIKNLNGMSAKNAKEKLREIFAKGNPGASLNRVNRQFKNDYSITLLALCETWHRLRSQNKSVEVMIDAFASTVNQKNKINHLLSKTIAQQRTRLAQLESIVAARTTTRTPRGSEDKSETGQVKLSGVQDPVDAAQVVGGEQSDQQQAGPWAKVKAAKS